MEGGGEGVVAVVSWLSDAGLAFSLVSSSLQCRPPEKLTAPRASRNPSNAVASQTVSEHNYKRRHLSPDPYASTYQVSHCGVDTRSFACTHTEFPPQRKKPSSEFGNFEVGYINRCNSPARSDIHSYRRKLDTLGSRGCQFRPQQERDVDAFVSSLRKYPSVTEHSPSAQLLQQLLKTSRNHSPKQSHAPAPSKKRRHYWDKPRPFASLNPYSNKQKESYRRSRKKKHTNTDVDSKEKECSLRGGLVSVTAFDYLNSGARSSARNLNKRIENTIFKNVFREKNRDKGTPVTAFPVCPMLQSRYEKHLKKYHAGTSKIPHVDLGELQTCSKCLQKRPCPCEAAKRIRRIVDKDVEEIRQFEDAIFSWLKDIPVYPNENPQDKFIRDAIVKKLAETLSKLNGADFAIEGKEEIKRALDKMPMWYPKGEKERENFKNDIIDNLLEKIKGVQEMKMFNQATQDFFDDIKFGKEVDAEQALDDIIRELNKIALNRPENNNVYRDLLKMKAFELLDGLNIKSSGNKYEYLNKLSDELADRLLNVSIKSQDAEQKSYLDNAIRNMLDETNVRIKDRDNVEEKLHAIIADVIAQNIDKDEAEMHIKSLLEGKVPESEIENITNKTLTLADTSQDVIQIDPDTTESILDDIRDILDDSEAQIRNRDQTEESLRKLVCDIATKGINEDKAETQIKSLLKGKVSDNQLKNITDRVLELAIEAKQSLFQPIDQETKRIINEDIRDILEHSDANIKNKDKVTDNLNKLVSDVITKGMSKEKASSEIKSILKGNVPKHKLEDITKQVLELAERTKEIEKDTKTIKRDIQDILDLSNVQIKNRVKVEENLSQLVSDITTKGIEEDKAKSKIKSLLKGKVPDNKLQEITEQVLILADRMKPIDNETKQVIKRDVQDILSDAQIKNKEKVEENLSKLVANITKKDIDQDQAETQIKAILKGKVSEDTLNDITEQTLKLVDRVKPLDSETKQIIKGDIQDILDLSNVQTKNRGKVEENLSNLVADITTKGMGEDKAKSQIKSILKGKVSEDKLEEITEQVLTLANQVKPLDNETKQVIKRDVQDILSDTQIKNKGKVEEHLRKLVANITTKDIDQDQAETQIKAFLKGKVSEDTLDEITEQTLKLVDRVKPLDNETKQIIKGDVQDILDLSNVQTKNRGKVEENLNKLVADITAKGMEEDKAKTQIKSILKGKVSEDKLEEITEQVLTLANRVKPIDNETKQVIKRDVQDILSDAQIKNKEKVEQNLSKLVASITKKDIDQDQAETQIKALLKGKVSEGTLEDIIEQTLKLVDRVKPLDSETKQAIKGDVQDVLDFSNIQIKNRGKVEEILSKLVADISKGMDKDKAETQIKSALKDTVPENKQDEIIKKVLALAIQMKTKVKSIDPETKQNIEKQISDILYQSEPDIKDKRKVEEKLRSIVSDILMKRIGRDKARLSIKSILKGKIPEDNIENIILKVLELAKRIEDNLSMQHSKLEETLKEDISDILDRTNVRIKNRDKVEEHIHNIVSDLVMRGLDKSKAQDYIYRTLKGNVSDSQIEDISMKILALAENLSRSYSENSGGPVASSTQNEEKILFDQVYEVIRDWLKHRDIHLSDKKLNEVAEAIANETLDRRKYLQLNPGVKISEAKESEILKEQIYKVLNNLIDKKSVQLIMTEADDLMNSLKQIHALHVSRESSKGLVQDSIQFIQENLEGALLNWLRQSPIYLSRDLRNKQTQEQIMVELAESLASVLGSQAIQKPGTNPDEVLLKEIIKHIERFPLEPEFKSKEYIRKLGNHILDYLKKIQLFQDISARDSQRTKSSFMSSTNQLNDIVKDWCDTLPLSNTDGAFRIKQDLANRIILKVGEMNMNQDIFNDDLLYDEILRDFIDQQVHELNLETHITDASKKLLIDQIQQVKQKIQDDFIGRKYKQQLRDTISNVLPSIACPMAEDLASFELMKENLADAFINLNYSVEDDTVRAKFKRRIMDEVNKYANDYLKRCPATPVSTRKLNEDLYNALKNVPVPGDESMRTEVESVRMKDVINDWLKTVPMSKQSISEQLHTNKVVTLMAQKLQELENEFHPNFEEIAIAEIASYLKKLPLKNKNNLREMAKKVVDKIKNTAESRAFVEGTRSKLTDDCLCEDFPLPCIPRRTSYLSCASFIPPCGLSKEDQEIMQRIRERAVLCEAGTQSRRCRDAAVNPAPLDHESQTDMPCNNKCCQHAGKPEHECSKSATLKTKRIPIGTRPCPSTEGQADSSPYVLVKEYYWDSNLGNKVEFATQTPAEESGRICIPSSCLNTERLCRPRSSLTSRRIPVKPRSRPEASTCQRPTPRRQFTSACPNEFFNRPKHCSRSPLVPDRDYLRSSYRCVGPSCGRLKSPCLSCKRDPTKICDKCFPMHVCPHPTCLYFK
ncbi:uncharacterized protein LOC133515635 [Cydia pomonella]|uniref:uncharacterized protein LOC133515635 n=1 Tax=Cydia pomonella TaxID=82600 RepID=UPI002ADE76F4|nr:uncharacterized protein LOC133515635 [Cydia pomonella]